MFRLHHIDIWVDNIDYSIKFYECLGFKKVQVFDDINDKKIILMKLNDLFLELKQHLSSDCSHNVVKCGDNKIFGLEVLDIHEAKRYLESTQLIKDEIIIKTGILNKKYFLIKDPNGLVIEIIES